MEDETERTEQSVPASTPQPQPPEQTSVPADHATVTPAVPEGELEPTLRPAASQVTPPPSASPTQPVPPPSVSGPGVGSSPVHGYPPPLYAGAPTPTSQAGYPQYQQSPIGSSPAHGYPPQYLPPGPVQGQYAPPPQAGYPAAGSSPAYSYPQPQPQVPPGVYPQYPQYQQPPVGPVPAQGYPQPQQPQYQPVPAPYAPTRAPRKLPLSLLIGLAILVLVIIGGVILIPMLSKSSLSSVKPIPYVPLTASREQTSTVSTNDPAQTNSFPAEKTLSAQNASKLKSVNPTVALPDTNIDSSAYVDGVVYIVSGNSNKAYAIDSKTGKTLWSQTFPGSVTSSNEDWAKPHAVEVADHVVYVASDEQVVAYKADAGTKLWSVSLTTSDAKPATLLAEQKTHVFYKFPIVDGNIFLTSSVWQKLFVINAVDGRIRWAETVKGQTYVPNILLSEPSVSGDTVVVIGSSLFMKTTVFAYNAKNRALLWTKQLGNDRYPAHPTISADTVYVTSGLQLYALSLKDGSDIWHTNGANVDAGGVAVLQDKVYVVFTNTVTKALQVVVYDAKSGNEQWRKLFATCNSAQYCYPTYLAVANGVLYTGDFEMSYAGKFTSQLYALDAQTGNTLWSSGVANDNIASLLAIENGMLYTLDYGLGITPHVDFHAYKAS